MYVEWRRIFRNGLRQVNQSSLPLFERTHHFRSYAAWLIPGILQTPAYAEQVLRSVQRRQNIAVDDIPETLAVRAERQQLLTQGKHVFGFLIEESVLRAAVVDDTTMAEQLRKLVDDAAMHNVSLGIVPSRVLRSHRPVESFWIFDNAQVNVELVSGYLKITQAREIATYARTFAELAELAVYGTEARRLITAAIDALQPPPGPTS